MVTNIDPGVLAADARSVRRVKRAEDGGGGDGNEQGTYRPYGLPAHVSPLNIPQGYNPALPFQPFTHGFGMGLDINDGELFKWGGDLDFPVVDKGGQVYYPFHLSGGFETGLDDIAIGYGHAVNPTNALNIPIDQVYPCFFQLCGQPQPLGPQPVYFQTPPPTVATTPFPGPELASLELDSEEEETTEKPTKATPSPTKPPTKAPKPKAKKTTPAATTEEPTTETEPTEGPSSRKLHTAIKAGDPASESNEIMFIG